MTTFANLRAACSLILLASLFLISGCGSGGNNLVTSPTAHSVAITWQSSPSPNLQGYKVYRSQISGGPYTPISSILPTSPEQFTDSSVVSGQDYFYVVTSIDVNGLESGPSPEVNAQIPTP